MNAPLDCRQGSVIVRFVLVFRGNVSLEMVEEIFMNGISNSAYTVDPQSIILQGENTHCIASDINSDQFNNRTMVN